MSTFYMLKKAKEKKNICFPAVDQDYCLFSSANYLVITGQISPDHPLADYILEIQQKQRNEANCCIPKHDYDMGPLSSYYPVFLSVAKDWRLGFPYIYWYNKYGTKLWCISLSMRVVLILANSVDTDEMQHYAAFHLGLHCLPKFQYKANFKKITWTIKPLMKYCHSDTV